MRGVDALLPVGCEIGIRRQGRARRGGVAWRDLDVDVGRIVAELGEPEALLVDEIEGEAVRPRWDRAAQVECPVDALAGRCAHLVAEPVPEDRIVALVQPVIREIEATPRSGARILQLNARLGQRAGLRTVELVAEPPHRERAGRNGMVTDCFQSRTSLRGVEPLLVRACRREPVERTPVWFMRQAGRSLPEYRELRKRYGLFDIVAQPELCAEVTLQPVHRHDVDAAVMFTDIMFPRPRHGRRGPAWSRTSARSSRPPLRARADVDRLVVPEPEASVPTILEAVRLVRAALRDDQAVIGFCGGPVHCRGIPDRGEAESRVRVRQGDMYREPETWHALMDKLADTFARYVVAQARAGAEVIQVFDSWVGVLSPSDYEEFVAPYSARILGAVDVPTIHFGTGTATLLSSMADASPEQASSASPLPGASRDRAGRSPFSIAAKPSTKPVGPPPACSRRAAKSTPPRTRPVKLVAFVAVGVFVTYFLFDGPVALFTEAMETPSAAAALTREPVWGTLVTMTLLSTVAIVLVPRQFHVTVVENHSESEIRRAAWLFPLYLVVINLFVIPIAVAGLVRLPPSTDSDMFVLALPLWVGSELLAMIAFVGGLSAATAMVIVETVALAIMASNKIVVPFVLQRREAILSGRGDVGAILLTVRRFSIFLILFIAYLYYLTAGEARTRFDWAPLVCGSRAACSGFLRGADLPRRRRTARSAWSKSSCICTPLLPNFRSKPDGQGLP